MSKSQTIYENIDIGTGIMASYGTGKFLAEFFAQAFGLVVFKYYETLKFAVFHNEQGYDKNLMLGFAALGFIIYSVYNAINDPLIGYITEKRTTRFSAKYGRRFPWIFIGSLLWVFSFILIFLIPSPFADNPIGTFIWMIFTTCLFDTLYSLWDVNYQSIFPDKFREEKIRQRTIGISTAIGIFGIASGFILPSIIIDLEASTMAQISDHIFNSVLFSIIGFFFVFLLIPGTRESPDMINRFLHDRKEKEKESFFREFVQALKVRNFAAWIVLYFFYQSGVVSFTASVQYIGDYILPEGQSTTLIFVGLLVGALIAVPLWQQINKAVKNNQRLMMMSAIVMAFFIIPITFIDTLESFTLFVFLGGLGFGGYWMIMTPALADVIDEIVVKTGKRNDGIFMGFRAFFGRFAFAVQAITFWVVHVATEFNPANITDLAKFGIHLHTGLIPAIFMVIGVIIFWKMNTLNPKKISNIKNELKSRGL